MTGARVLVVDDNIEMARMLCDELHDRGYDAFPMTTTSDALRALESEVIDAVVTDLRLPDGDGLQILASSKRGQPDRPVLVMTAYGAVDSAVESIRKGAHHYLTKPFDAGELALFLDRALDDRTMRREVGRLRSVLREKRATPQLVPHSEAMRRVVELLGRFARSPLPVLLTGETGTGKTYLARAIHDASERADGPLVSVNCAALPDGLLETELFGHVKGAFTGASQARTGLFLEADGGTLLLDEIGDMPAAMQAKLLHVIEEGLVRPVGAERALPVNVRVIAATNQDLRDRVQKGRFREDLFFRLDVLAFELPPLRQRREDILELASRFLAEARGRHPDSPVERFSPAVIDRLQSHRWPGNVRELRHVVERLVALGGGVETAERDLPTTFGSPASAMTTTFHEIMPIRRLQRLYARWVLEKVEGHRARAAERLEVDGKTLARWLNESDEPAEGAQENEGKP
jgi:two-component system response regulator HydG